MMNTFSQNSGELVAIQVKVEGARTMQPAFSTNRIHRTERADQDDTNWSDERVAKCFDKRNHSSRSRDCDTFRERKKKKKGIPYISLGGFFTYTFNGTQAKYSNRLFVWNRLPSADIPAEESFLFRFVAGTITCGCYFNYIFPSSQNHDKKKEKKPIHKYLG